MVTISHIVQKIVNKRIFIQESMSKHIISYAALAKQLQPEIEQELERPVKRHAIEMALRRYADHVNKTHHPISFDYSSDIIMKTHICDISVLRTPSFLKKIKYLYDVVDLEKGDLLNIIHGSSEVSIVTNERYRQIFIDILKNESIVNVEEGLVSLSMTFSKDFLYTPGVIFNIIRNIAWENINIFEIISTNTELTFIIHKSNAINGYKALEQLLHH